MKAISDVIACVVDHGLFLPLAIELTKHYKRVLYQNAASVDGFPTLNKCIIGDGIDGLDIIRLPEDHWDYKDEIDLYVFPDLYHGGEQLELASQGKAVWGSRHGDRMEVYRGRFLDALMEAGLDVADHEVITGISKLRDFLRTRVDEYVKISTFRGTMETFHWRDWEHDEDWLDHMAVKLGPAKELLNFYVFHAIETDIEIGLDTYCVDGKFPTHMVVGYEYKDKGYFGAVMPQDEVPKQLKEASIAFQKELLSESYRNFISIEVRIKGDKFYFIDPTRRMPCPAGGSQLKFYSNLGEIIFCGAQGVMAEPEMRAVYACECVMTAKGVKDGWTCIEFPEALKDSVICGSSCEIDGRTCWPPDDSHGEEVGWLVHTGSTPKSTIQGMLDKAALLPDGVTAATESLAQLLKEVETGHEAGVPFTADPLPEPSIVLENT